MRTDGRYSRTRMLRVEALFADLVAKEAKRVGLTIPEATREIRYALFPESDVTKSMAKERDAVWARVDATQAEKETAKNARKRRAKKAKSAGPALVK